MHIDQFIRIICRANNLPEDTPIYINPHEVTQNFDTWEFKHMYYFDEDNNVRELNLGKPYPASKNKRQHNERNIPILTNTLPHTQTMPNNKLANELQKGLVNDGATALIVADKKKQVESHALINLTQANDDEKLIIDQRQYLYTEYDRQVMDSIISLYLSGEQNRTFTPETVYRTMTHKRDSETPSKEQINTIINSIDKLRRIHAHVDATEEMQKRGVKDKQGSPIDKFIIDDFLLNVTAVTVRAGGRTVQAYKILSEPILYTYSALVKQIITVPARLLDVKALDNSKSLSNTPGRIALKGNLLRRINVIKQNPAISNTVLFDTVFKQTCQESADRITLKRNRDYIFQCLDYWQAEGLIKGYEKIIRKKAIAGVKIHT